VPLVAFNMTTGETKEIGVGVEDELSRFRAQAEWLGRKIELAKNTVSVRRDGLATLKAALPTSGFPEDACKSWWAAEMKSMLKAKTRLRRLRRRLQLLPKVRPAPAHGQLSPAGPLQKLTAYMKARSPCSQPAVAPHPMRRTATATGRTSCSPLWMPSSTRGCAARCASWAATQASCSRCAL
jgi:hypothetical protein